MMHHLQRTWTEFIYESLFLTNLELVPIQNCFVLYSQLYFECTWVVLEQTYSTLPALSLYQSDPTEVAHGQALSECLSLNKGE